MADPLLISNIDNGAGENVVDNTITNNLDILMYDNDDPVSDVSTTDPNIAFDNLQDNLRS